MLVLAFVFLVGVVGACFLLLVVGVFFFFFLPLSVCAFLAVVPFAGFFDLELESRLDSRAAAASAGVKVVGAAMTVSAGGGI